MCQMRVTARPEPSLNFGEVAVGFGCSPARPRYTVGSHGSLVCGAAPYTVRPSRGSRIMWYTAMPFMTGPSTDHFLRSEEWNRNPPFFVPTATTTLPFLIRAMSTSCNAREDMDHIPAPEPCFGERRPQEVLVHEDVHVLPPVPASSTTRSRIPGNARSSARRSDATSSASRTTSSCPSVYERSAGGIRTVTPVRAISSDEARVATTFPHPHRRRDEKPLAAHAGSR